MSSTTPTKPNHHHKNAVTPEEEGGSHHKSKQVTPEEEGEGRHRKRQQGEDGVEPNHHPGDNGGSESSTANAPPNAEDNDGESTPVLGTTVNDEIKCIVTKRRKQGGGVLPNHTGDNGGSECTNAPPNAEDNDDELTPVLGTTVNDEITCIVTKHLWSGTEVVVIAAMHRLRYLFSPVCNHFEENRKFAFQLGAPSVVVKAMSRYEDSYPVQGYGCTLLAGIIPPTMTDHVEQDIIDVGGLAQCLVAMDRYIEQPNVQLVGCKLIGMLWRRLPHAQMSVIMAGGAEAVVRAMVTHKQNVQVQQYGFAALGQMLHCAHCGQMGTE